jgi:CO dehydrogenase maturation factor
MAKKKGYTIAMAGKGGTGKTTLAGLLVRFLKEQDMTPILAVDADANSNLNEVLGLEVEETLGEAREMMKKDVPVGMTKDIFIEMKVEQSLVEANGFDLMVMGRPEGPGCYCAANSLLSKFIERMMDNYPYLVVDNEAGMEHFSRLTTKYIDVGFFQPVAFMTWWMSLISEWAGSTFWLTSIAISWRDWLPKRRRSSVLTR